MGWFFNCRAPCDGSMLLIQRLALLLLFALPAFLPNTALADYPKTLTRYELTGWGQSNSSYEALCSYFLNVKQTAYQNETIVISSCTETGVLLQGSDYYNNGIKKYGSCNGVETLWGSGICEGEAPPPPPPPPPPCEAGCNGACGSPYKVYGSSYGFTGCIGGCTYNFGNGIEGSGGGYWIVQVGSNTGQTCTNPTPAPDVQLPSPEYDCVKSGKSYGTVNGVVVCVNGGTPGTPTLKTVDSGTKVTTTDANGNEVTTTTPPTETIAGTDPNGTPIISETATNADGTKIKTESTKDSFCESNPNSPLCKAEETCVKTPDAPVCKHLCEKYPNSIACQEKASFFTDLKKAIFGTLETDLASAPADGGILTQDIDLSFAEVSLPQSMSCPPPISIAFGGHAVSISYDWLCDYADSFRPVVIAFAYMAAIMIVFGATRKEA